MAITPQDVERALEAVYGFKRLKGGLFISTAQGTPSNYVNAIVNSATEKVDLTNFSLPDGTDLVAVGQFELKGHIVMPNTYGDPIRVGGYQFGVDDPQKFLIIDDGVCEQISDFLNQSEQATAQAKYRSKEKASLWAKVKSYFGFWVIASKHPGQSIFCPTTWGPD